MEPSYALTLSAKREAATPMEKVLELISGLITEVETEGKTEATNYAEFACFCKDTTADKSKAITSGQDKIDQLAADIEADNATRMEKQAELKKETGKKEEKLKEQEEAIAECAKEEATYDQKSSELQSGLDGCKAALKVLADTKASFLDVAQKQSIRHSLELASAFKLLENNRFSVHHAMSLLQKVDPNDPDYKSHTGGITAILEKMQQFLTDKKADLDGEWTKTKKTCDDTKTELAANIKLLEDAIDKLGTAISGLKTKIATDRGDLVTAEATLKDDKVYLTDLTEMCQERANEWDQRTLMRSKELDALNEVKTILGDDVKKADTALGGKDRRALLQATQPMAVASKVATAARSSVRSEGKVLSLLQEARKASSSESDRRDHALQFLQQEGSRLDSMVLSALATKAAADPFKKVKVIIQNLIERLLKEALAETNKKGFCDKEMNEARTERTFRFNRVQELDADVSSLETKQDELEIEIETLGKAVDDLEFALAEATKTRKAEKGTNAQTVKDAKEGLDAITKCIIILKGFYGDAAKAMLQVKASPVAEDTSGPGFSGSYKGAQSGAVGVISMMQVIQTDFERTIRNTERAEAAALKAFVEFDRQSKADIAAKTMKEELCREDLAKTVHTIKSKMAELEDQMGLLDSALKQLEELQPMCVDTGMTYAERKQKREDEIDALKKALCILDPDKVETECQGR